MTGGVKSFKTRSGIDITIRYDPSLNAPSVVLLGWFMAKETHLKKYADAWNNLGFTTISTIGSAQNCFALDYKKARPFLNEVLKALSEDNRLYTNGTIFQVFSMGGAVYAPWLVEAIGNEDKVARCIKSVVFDSSPGYLHYEQ